ncbi:MAG: Gfo/Idh/MocA family oxidoreductase [Clostridia bacterium]|nr:Gfo/Idh/MocA family oxidoreductase [Clostridia bacterium]
MADSVAGFLNVGIIGVGNIGTVHASAVFRGAIRGMRLGALCDIDGAKRERFSDMFPGVPVYADARKLIADAPELGLDAVIVSVPHRLHAEIATAAFNAGLHVLSEKPADVEYSKALLMNDAAVRSGKVFGIMFNQRTDPLFRKAKEIIASGELGAFKRSSWIITNWYRTQAYYESSGWRATWIGEGGGVLLNQAPHNIDIWLWLLGLPSRVRAFCYEGKYHRITVEDDATVYAEFPGGGTGVFVTSTGEAPGVNRLELSFENGRLILENGQLSVLRLGISERELCFTSKESFVQPPVTEEVFTDTCVRDGHELILENFASAVLGGDELISPGSAGLSELAFSNAAFLSSWTGDWVELPLSEADQKRFSAMLEEKRETERLCRRAGSTDGDRRDADSGGSGNAVNYSERWTTRW